MFLLMKLTFFDDSLRYNLREKRSNNPILDLNRGFYDRNSHATWPCVYLPNPPITGRIQNKVFFRMQIV